MQLERFLRAISIAAITALPFIPLLVSGSMFFPYITGKNFAFRILVEIALGSWLVLAAFRPAYRPSFSWILAALSAFVISIGISNTLGPNAFKSFWSNFERMEGWVTLIHLLGLALVMAGVMKTAELWRRFMLTTLLGGAFVAVVGAIAKSHELLVLAALVLYGVGLTIMLIRDERLAQQIFAWTLGGIFSCGIFVIGSWYTYIAGLAGGQRISGTFGNPIYLAVYAAFHVFFAALLLVWYRPRGFMRIGIYIAGALLTAVMILTATRGTTLGLFGGAVAGGLCYLLTLLSVRARVIIGSAFGIGLGVAFAAVVVLLFGDESVSAMGYRGLWIALTIMAAAIGAVSALILTYQRKNIGATTIAGLLLAGVALAGGFALLKDRPFMQEIPIVARFASISLESGTAASRSMIWNMGIVGFKERPLLGWGQENFSFVFDAFYDPNMYAQEPWFDRVHNIVFDWLIQGGAVGAALYFSLPLLILYYVWLYRRQDSPLSDVERSIITGMLLMYFFHNMFVFDNVVSYIYYIVLLCYVHTRQTSESPVLVPSVSVSENTATTIVGPAAVVFTAATIYFVNVPGMATATDLITALMPQPGGFGRNIAAYEEAFARGGLGRQEVAEQLVQGGAMVVRNPQAPAELREQITSLANRSMSAEIARVPDSARLRLFYATFLGQTGSLDLALEQISEAERIAPNKQLVKFQKTEILLNQNKIPEANQAMEEAYALAPTFSDATILLAFTSLYAGDHARAKEVLLARFGTEAYDDERLVRAYVAQKIFAPVIEILKNRVQQNPLEAQYRVSLAAAYRDDGQKEMAIRTLEEAIVAIPALKTEGESFIAQIRAQK
jgi:tetratricopeptide (TPR) repeat protein